MAKNDGMKIYKKYTFQRTCDGKHAWKTELTKKILAWVDNKPAFKAVLMNPLFDLCVMKPMHLTNHVHEAEPVPRIQLFGEDSKKIRLDALLNIIYVIFLKIGYIFQNPSYIYDPQSRKKYNKVCENKFCFNPWHLETQSLESQPKMDSEAMSQLLSDMRSYVNKLVDHMRDDDVNLKANHDRACNEKLAEKLKTACEENETLRSELEELRSKDVMQTYDYMLMLNEIQKLNAHIEDMLVLKIW